MFETPEEFRRRAGRIEVGRSYELTSRGNVIGHFIVAALLVGVLVGGALWLLWPMLLPPVIGVLGFTVYCAIAYFVRARPNHDHLREPFGEYRLSDDVNWNLIWLAILLAPGRFISVGIVDGVRLLALGRLPHEGPTPGPR